jgi:hypothetical protein
VSTVPINCFICGGTHWTRAAVQRCRMQKLAGMSASEVYKALGWDRLSAEELEAKLAKLDSAFEGTSD